MSTIRFDKLAEAGFKQINLVSRDKSHIATVALPPMDLEPEILVWGARFFVRNNQADTYIEGLPYFVQSEFTVLEEN